MSPFSGPSVLAVMPLTLEDVDRSRAQSNEDCGFHSLYSRACTVVLKLVTGAWSIQWCRGKVIKEIGNIKLIKTIYYVEIKNVLHHSAQ